MLFEIVKCDGSREKVEGSASNLFEGSMEIMDESYQPLVTYAPGQWLEVWRREGVSE